MRYCLGSVAQPRCSALVPQGRCPSCARTTARPTDQRRGSSSARGYTHTWHKARTRYLQQPEHTWCVDCYQDGRLTAATVVDHVTPHKGDRALFWDQGNWAPRCKRCHDRKTARQDGGFGRAR